MQSKKSLVLFGDSHAAQWFPALEIFAQAKGYQLYSYTKSACPAAKVELPNRDGFRNSECQKWRQSIVKRIEEISPVAVIMSGFQHFKPPSNVTNSEEWWKVGMSRLQEDLKDNDTLQIYLGDTPNPMVNVPECLSRNSISECSKVEFSPVWSIPSFSFIDPTSWLCTKTCPVVIGKTVAYRDGSHISVDMALQLSEELSKALSLRL
jgi:hypothetical protein